MARFILIVSILFFVFSVKTQTSLNRADLMSIPGVIEVNELPDIDYFTDVYEVYFEQFIDYSDSSKGTFNQRFSISNVSLDSMVVVELEGYALYSTEANELSVKLHSNQVNIEHRYFDKSKPNDSIDWTTLTVRNAAIDQHRIISALKKSIYKRNKFISTGISKGGQTTMLHRMYFPDDVDGSVCYVAPLNLEREDVRVYDFLNTVGTGKQRKQIKNFQINCLKRKKELSLILGQIGAYNGLSWKIGPELAFEYYVLEYPFAFWQWGKSSFESIPNSNASNNDIIQHLLKISGLSFFEDKGIDRIQAFFCAGMSQMGIYGYEYKPFKKYLTKQEDYSFEFTLPSGYRPEFSNKEMLRLDAYIKNKAENFVFIYGGLDTWTATAVSLDSDKDSIRDVYKYVLGTGHHGTRIGSFSSEIQQEVFTKIKSWCYINN